MRGGQLGAGVQNRFELPVFILRERAWPTGEPAGGQPCGRQCRGLMWSPAGLVKAAPRPVAQCGVASLPAAFGEFAVQGGERYATAGRGDASGEVGVVDVEAAASPVASRGHLVPVLGAGVPLHSVRRAAGLLPRRREGTVRTWTHLRDEFEQRRAAARAAGRQPDPKEARIARLRELNQPLTGKLAPTNTEFTLLKGTSPATAVGPGGQGRRTRTAPARTEYVRHPCHFRLATTNWGTTPRASSPSPAADVTPTCGRRRHLIHDTPGLAIS